MLYQIHSPPRHRPAAQPQEKIDRKLTKYDMARRMRTSRAALDRRFRRSGVTEIT